MGYIIIEGEDSKGKYRKYVNEETGEVEHIKYLREMYVEEGHYFLEIDPSDIERTGREPWFIRVYRTNWRDIVIKKRLTFTEVGVLMSMMAFLDWESNYLVHPKTHQLLNLQQLAELLQCDRRNLDKIIKSLNDKGLVAITLNGRGRGNVYQLNSHVLFFGEKIRDVNDHKVFDTMSYKPVVYKRYRQRTSK